MSLSETNTSGIIPIEFSPELSGDILDAALGIPTDLNHTEASFAADEVSKGLSPLVHDEIARIYAGDSYGYVVGAQNPNISGLSLEQRTNLGRVSALSIAHALGDVGTSRYEEGGALTSLVERTPGFEKTISYRGGDVPQRHHQEMLAEAGKSTRDALTDFVILSLVSNTNPPTPTLIADIEAALKQLPDDTIDELRKAHFSMRPYDAQKKEDVDVEEKEPEPIIHPDGLVVVDFDDIEAKTPEAKQALELFNSAVEKVTEESHMKPGQTLVADNHRATHGRSVIHPNGRRRLIRAHVVNSPPRPLPVIDRSRVNN